MTTATANYNEYLTHMAATMPDCEPMSFEHWVAATERQNAESKVHAAAMSRWN